MAPDWRSVLRADPTDWLLERDNPSVRYFTLKDILDHSDASPEVEEARRSIGGWGKVSRIFAKQRHNGSWESVDQPYLPKYRGTYWQVMILGQLGLDRGDERVRRACEHIFKFQLGEGGFAMFAEEGARREYELKMKRATAKGKGLPPFHVWAKEVIREGELSCLTGNIATALIRLGYGEDERVSRALDWLVDVQNADGGWLCPYWKAHIRDRHGCFMGAITPLDAFSEVPSGQRTPGMRDSVERGVEFLLMHRLFRADHHGYEVINGSWLKLGFPCFSYDVLRGLDVVARLGYADDERIDDDLEVVLGKQSPDGRWTLESSPSGRMQVDLERKGEPSKWVTLRGLRTIKRIHPARDA